MFSDKDLFCLRFSAITMYYCTPSEQLKNINKVSSHHGRK